MTKQVMQVVNRLKKVPSSNRKARQSQAAISVMCARHPHCMNPWSIGAEKAGFHPIRAEHASRRRSQRGGCTANPSTHVIVQPSHARKWILNNDKALCLHRAQNMPGSVMNCGRLLNLVILKRSVGWKSVQCLRSWMEVRPVLAEFIPAGGHSFSK